MAADHLILYHLHYIINRTVYSNTVFIHGFQSYLIYDSNTDYCKNDIYDYYEMLRYYYP